MKIDFKTKKYLLLDLDGTIYAGSKLYPYTLDFLERLRAAGKQPIFLTNNSSRSTQEYLEKFAKMGIDCSSEEIYSSTLATIDYLKSRKLYRIFLMASPAVEDEFEKAGFELCPSESKNQNGLNKPKIDLKSVHVHTLESMPGHRFQSLAQLPQAVVLTFDQTFTYQKFCHAYDYIMAGVPFIATHPDKLLPLEGGKFHPDIGALISAFETAIEAGKAAGSGAGSPLTSLSAIRKSPTIIGKPQKPIYAQLQARLKCQKSEMLMVGDRLYTDIKGANDFGIDTVLVLSGETTAAMAKKSKIKATAIVNNIGELI